MGVKEEHLLVTTRAKKYSDFLGYEKRIFIEQGSGRSFRYRDVAGVNHMICNLNLTTAVGAAKIC
jgi:hypothetical protein